jgi:hypothetical protein
LRLWLFENGRIEMVVEEKLVLELCVIIGVFPFITFEMDSLFLVLNRKGGIACSGSSRILMFNVYYFPTNTCEQNTLDIYPACLNRPDDK